MNDMTNSTHFSEQPFDSTNALDVSGPTAKQELFLRRQGLWSEDLSQADASWLIGERLKELHGRRKSAAF